MLSPHYFRKTTPNHRLNSALLARSSHMPPSARISEDYPSGVRQSPLRKLHTSNEGVGNSLNAPFDFVCRPFPRYFALGLMFAYAFLTASDRWSLAAAWFQRARDIPSDARVDMHRAASRRPRLFHRRLRCHATNTVGRVNEWFLLPDSRKALQNSLLISDLPVAAANCTTLST